MPVVTDCPVARAQTVPTVEKYSGVITRKKRAISKKDRTALRTPNAFRMLIAPPRC
jgi:hypothetical protein